MLIVQSGGKQHAGATAGTADVPNAPLIVLTRGAFPDSVGPGPSPGKSIKAPR